MWKAIGVCVTAFLAAFGGSSEDSFLLSLLILFLYGFYCYVFKYGSQASQKTVCQVYLWIGSILAAFFKPLCLFYYRNATENSLDLSGRDLLTLAGGCVPVLVMCSYTSLPESVYGNWVSQVLSYWNGNSGVPSDAGTGGTTTATTESPAPNFGGPMNLNLDNVRSNTPGEGRSGEHDDANYDQLQIQKQISRRRSEQASQQLLYDLYGQKRKETGFNVTGVEIVLKATDCSDTDTTWTRSGHEDLLCKAMEQENTDRLKRKRLKAKLRGSERQEKKVKYNLAILKLLKEREDILLQIVEEFSEIETHLPALMNMAFRAFPANHGDESNAGHLEPTGAKTRQPVFEPLGARAKECDQRAAKTDSDIWRSHQPGVGQQWLLTLKERKRNESNVIVAVIRLDQTDCKATTLMREYYENSLKKARQQEFDYWKKRQRLETKLQSSRVQSAPDPKEEAKIRRKLDEVKQIDAILWREVIHSSRIIVDNFTSIDKHVGKLMGLLNQLHQVNGSILGHTTLQWTNC